jgi:hypothetical protein
MGKTRLAGCGFESVREVRKTVEKQQKTGISHGLQGDRRVLDNDVCRE